MLVPNYVNFKEPLSPADRPLRASLLSFLPLAYHYCIQDHLQGIYIELDELVLLEIKGPIDGMAFRLDLLTEEIGFWQQYQFANMAELYLPHSLPLSDNRCISFSSANKKVPLSLNSGVQWVVFIGYKKNVIFQLLKEFPMLGSLVFGDPSQKTSIYWETDISISHSLRKAWCDISAIAYRPFSGTAELILGVTKLLDEYCRQLDKQADQGEGSMLVLYHKALAYIRENLLDSIDKEMVAKALNVHVRKLNRAFEGRPVKIMDYIQKLKLNHARDLLYEGEMSVEAISNLLNYPNRKYFSKEFKKYFFQSPTLFRKEMGDFQQSESNAEQADDDNSQD